MKTIEFDTHFIKAVDTHGSYNGAESDAGVGGGG